MSKNTNICNNCGKQGHMFHQCKLPITSYGIIAFRSSEEGIQYLMIINLMQIKLKMKERP